jgi:hypothetical protein
MAYLIVIGVSVLVGGAVYLATMRGGDQGPAAVGFSGAPAADGGEPSSLAAEAPGPGYTYLRVATRGPTWRDRLQGFIGVVILVVIGAAVLAFGVYQLGHLVNLTIERFLDS